MVQFLAVLVAVMLIQSAPYYVYLPAITAAPPSKGLAGSASIAQMQEVQATWRHGWALCPASAGPECVDVSKGFWTWEPAPSGYGQGPDQIAAAMEACRSGWLMVGDEWVLQQKPMQEQVEELHWYLDKRDEVNPDCRIAFGGVLTFHPSCRPMLVAPNWVPEFYDAYVDSYGEAPDVQALVLDDYYWDFWYIMAGMEPFEWEPVTQLSVDAIHDTYGPDVEVWAREIGSLMSHENALKAMGMMEPVTRHYDRYAWFISQDGSGYWGYTALWVNGELTDLGEMYREFQGW